ncbi:hypothetical protein AKJ09_04245 [Labilithrix luteola]|uniref:Cytochrome c domain-containing protein n=1 Tax=Labilithrix luteola TaxID=1391654 RepID=A0A0K1PW07_9BACT|nr:cytochrome C [Labilithrix luteola]AKU97581.1 hypothetical protein AKJ09_04245 [Labilithrix luteola]
MRIPSKVVAVALVLGFASVAVADGPRPAHVVPASPDGDLVVALCDGETSAVVRGVKPGQILSRDRAQSVSDELMNEWKKKNPGAGADWDKETLVAQNVKQPSPTSAPRPADSAQGGGAALMPAAGASAQQPRVQGGHTYGAYTTRDEQIWAASTKAFVDSGDKIFHDPKAFGGTIGVSCDMCHPNAANTHPETYPKFQVQLGKVALLRDMINWCIENPARGKPLADDDPRMKAMESYILAQRKGYKLDFGKH